MSSPVVTVRVQEKFSDLYAKLKSCSHSAFPVVDEYNEYIGKMLRHHIVILMRHKAWAGFEGQMRLSDFEKTKDSDPFLLEDLPYSPNCLEQMADDIIDMSFYM
jgi:hypothetical protein